MLFHSAILLERMGSNAFWEIGCAMARAKPGVALTSRITPEGLLLNHSGRHSIHRCDFLIASLQAKAHTGVGSDPSWQQNMLPDECPCNSEISHATPYPSSGFRASGVHCFRLIK